METVTWQPSLLGGTAIAWDRGFTAVRRRGLAPDAWVDHADGWLRGDDELFARVVAAADWEQPLVTMWDSRMRTPRLLTRWSLEHAPEGDLVPIPELRRLGADLSRRYGVRFTSVGANLYRDGADSVAWHGDRIARERSSATIAIVSLGEPRSFRLRPKPGRGVRAPSLTYRLGQGALLVMGGSCQRTWDHAVPKVRHAGPRISLTFRHAYDDAAADGAVDGPSAARDGASARRTPA